MTVTYIMIEITFVVSIINEKDELFKLLSVNTVDELEKLIISGDEHTIQTLNMYFSNVWLLEL